MSTPFVDVYDKFFQLVTDNKVFSLQTEQIEQLLFGFLEQASQVEFKGCHTDLSMNIENKCFVKTLSVEEQWILANYMQLAWIRKPLSTESNIREKIGHKDYQIYSPANRLKELRELEQNIEKRVKRYKINYQYAREDFDGFIE